MLRRSIYQAICSISVLVIVAGCRPQQTDPLPEDSTKSTAAPIEVTGGNESVPLATETPLPTATLLPSPPGGWVELSGIDLAVSLYRPSDWEVTPFDDHKLDLRAPEGDGWIEINKVDASNAQDWGAADQTWDAQLIVTTLLTAAREDGEFADPMQVATITGSQAWATQGVNDVIRDRLWFGVIGLNDGAIVVLGHGQETTENWDSELVPAYETILGSIHRAP